jgi:hypothetical protein
LCQFTDATNPPEGWNHVGTAKDRRPIFAKEGSKSKRRKSKKYPDVLDLQPQKKRISPAIRMFVFQYKTWIKGTQYGSSRGIQGERKHCTLSTESMGNEFRVNRLW